MSELHLATCLDTIAAAQPELDALIQGARRLSWAEVERRASSLAGWMKRAGASHQGKVALYTYNHPAYLESCYAAFKAGLVPVNVNYRYRAEELRYLLDNADAEIAIVHTDFVPLLERVRGDLPKLRGVLVVGEGAAVRGSGVEDGAAVQKSGPYEGGDSPGGGDGVEDYETVADAGLTAPPAPRTDDDLLLLYTGGTTGMPKGVMWRQRELYLRLAGGGLLPAPRTPEAFREFVANQPLRLRALIAPPLMHGTGWFTALIAWLAGGAVIMLDNPKGFEAAECWQIVERERATNITIVGDSFAKPMLRELEAGPRRDLSSLMLISSSGVMWSEETKQGLLSHLPQVTLVDSFSSSEAVGMGTAITTSAGAVRTARFQLSETTRLFDERLRPIETLPGAKGLVGVGGAQPVGYFKDEEKSARTFVAVDGIRFSIPGDWAVVNEDGRTLTLLGRGSVCINTGGEKVFPEEVEEVVKRFPRVRDAVVVGVPDERWGEAVTAVLSAEGGPVDPDALKAFVKEHLAGFKVPKHVILVEQVYRSPSGKADFARTRTMALEALGKQS